MTVDDLPRFIRDRLVAADRPTRTAVVAAANDGAQTGAMLALVPSSNEADRLALDVDGAEPAEQLHVTLYYLGEAAGWSPTARTALVDAVRRAVADRVAAPVQANVFGADLWNPTSDDPAWVLAVGDDPACGAGPDATSPCLQWVRDHVGDAMLAAAYAAGDEVPTIPQQHTPWVPHVCLAYSADPGLLDQMIERVGPVTFTDVRVAFAGEVTDVPLAPADDATDDGQLGGKPNPGTKPDRRLKENKNKKPTYVDDVVDLAAGPTVTGDMPMTTWRGVLVVEGEPTGDGREFAPGSITWPDPATTVIPLRWNVEDSHGGEKRTTAVAVGRITEIWRDGSNVMGAGTFNMDDPNGVQAYTNVKNGFLAGVSIDADDIAEADVEYVWPENAGADGVDEADDIISILFGTPELVIFHAGRIRAATLCDIPAYVDAAIALTDPDEAAALAAGAVAQLGAVGTHTTATTDATWDGPAAERNLPSPVPVAKARAAYAWLDDGAVADGAVPKTAGRFIHHEVAADGTVGAANLTACSTGIGVLHGGRGGTDVADPRGVYNHLARHLRDAGQEPPPFEGDALAASAALLAGAAGWRPDPTWFTDPRFTVASPIVVTDDGRVYGHAAEWGQCHIGYPRECVTPPRENDHPYFMTGSVLTADGTRVAVGQITADIGHAPLNWSAHRAAGHYDNTEYVVADVAIGNDRHGIWVAGAVRPWATDRQVHGLRASGQVSPDWRSIGGRLRMVGMLTVNTSGYQARRRAQVAVTADGSIKSLVSSGFTSVRRAVESDAELNQRALNLLREGLRARMRGV